MEEKTTPLPELCISVNPVNSALNSVYGMTREKH